MDSKIQFDVPAVAVGDIGHQVDTAGSERVQAFLPFAAYGFEFPAFGLCDFTQQVAVDAARQAIFAHQELRRVFVDPDPDDRFCGRCSKGRQQCQQQQENAFQHVSHPFFLARIHQNPRGADFSLFIHVGLRPDAQK